MNNNPEGVPIAGAKRKRAVTWYLDQGFHKTDDTQPRERRISGQEVIELNLTNRDDVSGALIKTMLREMQETFLPDVLAACASSVIAACFKDMGPVTISLLEETVGRVNVINDANRERNLHELDMPDSPLLTYLHVAQMILIVFKSVHQNSYEQFLVKRIKAIKALVGLAEGEEVAVLLPIEKAMLVRARLGSSLTYKKKLLEILLAHRTLNNKLGLMCNYLCIILDWHEMTNVLFIVQTIVATDSPILYDLRISADVLAFIEAARAIHFSSHSGYFRILETNLFKRSLVERSKFPLLSAAAQRIKAQSAGSALNYQGTPGQQPPLVNALILKHNQYIAGINPDIHRDRILYLVHYEEEEEI